MTAYSTYSDYEKCWDDPKTRQVHIDQYTSKQMSFIPHLLPELAVQLTTQETLVILRARYGSDLDTALSPTFTNSTPLLKAIPHSIQSPVTHHANGEWLKTTNMVGINVRTIHNFWNIVKYALTLPAIQNAIHILPIWEPGVVASLYGMSSWQINREFFSSDLEKEVPHLNTVERQLKAVINILHLMGRTVGMDVIPHTDRFAEIVLANPGHFEWLQRKGTEIINHDENLHLPVQKAIYEWLVSSGSAAPDLTIPPQDFFFSDSLSESKRLLLLFGPPRDQDHRRIRRIGLIKHLRHECFEPVPATMAPPFRGLEVDPSQSAHKIDENGLEWRDFRITHPEEMSRVFGPLTRYKLFSRLDNNQDWEIDFSHPRENVWTYIKRKYALIQARFGFDFMRGDMSHVQMRTEGVPNNTGPYYDLLGSIKQYIREELGIRYFGYFAESFLAAPGIMGYGPEEDHLEASFADSTLGNLQSMVVGSEEFLRTFEQYLQIAQTRKFRPNFTLFTSDKDDPRFDSFYMDGNELRLFIAYFLPDLPSYTALGYFTRDFHPSPAPNEHYTKLYVFQEKTGPKSTHGPYVWGKNVDLFNKIARLNSFAESFPTLPTNLRTQWVAAPSTDPPNRLLIWKFNMGNSEYIFFANADLNATSTFFSDKLSSTRINCIFSTLANQKLSNDNDVDDNGKAILHFQPGECKIYQSTLRT